MCAHVFLLLQLSLELEDSLFFFGELALGLLGCLSLALGSSPRIA
jgi:hypothetical protein